MNMMIEEARLNYNPFSTPLRARNLSRYIILNVCCFEACFSSRFLRVKEALEKSPLGDFLYSLKSFLGLKNNGKILFV